MDEADGRERLRYEIVKWKRGKGIYLYVKAKAKAGGRPFTLSFAHTLGGRNTVGPNGCSSDHQMQSVPGSAFFSSYSIYLSIYPSRIDQRIQESLRLLTH